ncbi:MAG: family 20 glycosylhydrolase [Terracidiphilus sp.]
MFRVSYLQKRLLISALFLFVAFGIPLLLPAALPAQDSPHSSSAPSEAAKLALIPMPREIREVGMIPMTQNVGILAEGRDPEDNFAAQDLVSALQERGIEATAGKKGRIRIVLLRQDTKKAADILSRVHLNFDPAMRDEGYVLVTENEITYDIAATSAGIYYGAQTIKQLITGSGAHAVLHTVVARDWPAMKYRGVSDDLSRGPIPTLEFQKHQVRVLSQYKVNIYSPYFENTLAFASNPLPALPGGAMTRADAEELVRYAGRYHVTIIPEQEAFGHLHRVLMYDTYSQLAETPHGSVLAPGQPGSQDLIRQWFTEMASVFPSPFLHIGADETFELGRGQTKERVTRVGLGAVYVDFLKQIHAGLTPLHRRLLFWGDIAMDSPQLVKTLPKDMIAVAWEYNPNPKGYDKWLLPYVDAGMETWVAPGVNNWRVVYPNFNAGLENIQRFVSDGQRLGSTGVLNTVWNDLGEGLFNLDWYGVLFGAAAGWQSGTSDIPQFQNSYGQAFHGDFTGKINQAQVELMAAHKTLKDAGLGSATDNLFWIDPWSADGQQLSAKLLPVAHTLRVHAEQAIILIEQARGTATLREPDALDAMEMGARRIDFIGYKFQVAQEIADGYRRAYLAQNDPATRRSVGRELGAITGVNGQCQDLREGYGLTRELFRNAWLQENRPYWLDNVMARYDLSMQLWIQHANRFSEASSQYRLTHVLPRPEEVGLPALPASTTPLQPAFSGIKSDN